MLGLLFSDFTGIVTDVVPWVCSKADRVLGPFMLNTNAFIKALRIPCTAHEEITMSSVKIIALSVSLFAAAVSSAAAQGVSYSGGPRTGQLNFNSEPGRHGSPLDARAQIVEPHQNAVKGGIASRGL